jgi:hypothetical protein
MLDKSESEIPPEIHQVVQPYLDQFADAGSGRETVLPDVQPWLGNSPPRGGQAVPNSFPNVVGGQPVPRQPLPVNGPSRWAPSSGIQQARQPPAAGSWNQFQR